MRVRAGRMKAWTRRAAGHTLAEMLVVLLVLGTVAKLALPSTEPAAGVRLDAAARDMAQALRFAQGAAQRTGAYHLVRCDTATGSIAVTRLDLTASPPAADLTIPVLHPIDKKDYKLVFSATPATAGVSIASCAFTFADNKSAPQVIFGADGTPVNVVGSGDKDVKALTGNGQIVLLAGQARRTVQLTAPTGRVTVAH